MIQLNLLPEVKKEYIKAKRTKRLIVSTSVIISASAVFLLFLQFSFVQFAQQKSISDLTKDIESEVASIQSVEGLDEILSIQNQLNTIPGLSEDRPETSRIFEYMRTVTPKDVFISRLDLDIENNKIEVSGTASSIASINTFADTLKFATYKTDDIEDGEPFTGVLTTLSRNNNKSSYSIELEFDPILFDNTETVVLVVPNTVTTRSVTGQPNLNSSDALFNDESSAGGE
jgi:Tfp pilus assembly protein PilN